jgi:hypothetical protein
MVLPDSVLPSCTMADKEYVSLSVEREAREALRMLVIDLSKILRRQVTISEALLLSVAFTTKPTEEVLDVIVRAEAELRANQSGGCE